LCAWRAYESRLSHLQVGIERLSRSAHGPENRPTFFDISKDYPAFDTVTKAFPAIRKEFDKLAAEGLSLPQYHEVDSGERAISNTTPNRWNVFILECLDYKVAPNVARCPETMKALAGVPDMIQAFFSILDPGKSVPEHEGPYLGYLRYHLGLRVPKKNPPKIVVNGQDYVWKEGEGVLFDDSWPHEVLQHKRRIARGADRRRARADAGDRQCRQQVRHRCGWPPFLRPSGCRKGRSLRPRRIDRLDQAARRALNRIAR
jgi:hypothetical protein